MAGVVGVNPYDFSMRELRWMATGAWDTSSLIAAVIANSNRDSKHKALGVESFHPYRMRELKKSATLTTTSLHAMKPLLVADD